jgi:hypothetical protein
MTALALIIRPIRHGWAVYLTDGRELARFRGPGSKRRALRYHQRHEGSADPGCRQEGGSTNGGHVLAWLAGRSVHG